MHQSVLRLRSCCQSRHYRYPCNIHVRRFSSAGTVPVANSDQRPTEALEPWQDTDGNALAKRENDAKNIIVNDLPATLEAHRASNRAAVIRKFNVNVTNALPAYQRLLLERDGDDGSEVNKTHEEEKKYTRCQTWPADSVQAKDMDRKRGNKGFVKKDVLEYTAVAHNPQGPWRIRNPFEGVQMQRPWLAYIKTTGEDRLQNLTNEIKAYEAYMRLSPREEAAAQLVISDVNSVVRNESAVEPLTLLGSRSTGLATPISDFDFTFAVPHSLPGGWKIPPNEDSVSQPQPTSSDIKLKARRALAKMVKYFYSSSKFGATEFVRFARVPIIRSTHVETKLAVQIQTMAPYQAAHEHTIAYLSEFPSLRPLYILLRYCLELRNLTTVFEGGLGSYSILMMIVTALKHSSGRFASDDLGSQLMYVLEFYGKANLYEVGFSANPPRVFEKQKEGWSLEERRVRFTDPQLSGIDQMPTFYPRKPYLLCLQDPANDLNDLGKNAYAIKHIQATFCGLRKSVEQKMKMSTVKSSDSTLCYLERLVSADYRPFESGRSRVERFADPKRRNDRDYSDKSILRQFEERVNWYKGAAERHHNLLKPAFKAIDKNAAKSAETKGNSSAGPRFPSAWYSQGLTRTRDGTLRIEESDEKEQADEKENPIPAQEKQEQSQMRLKTDNDSDNNGWHPSSPTDAKTLLEAVAAPKAARAPETQNQNQARPRKTPPAESPRPPRPPVVLSWDTEPDGPPLRSLGTLTAAQDEVSGPDPYVDVEDLGLGSDMPPMYKEHVNSWHLAKRLGSDGAILPRRRRDEEEGKEEKSSAVG